MERNAILTLLGSGHQNLHETYQSECTVENS